MSSSAQVIQKSKIENVGFFEKAKPHAELIAAITSGVLIAAGWVLEKVRCK